MASITDEDLSEPLSQGLSPISVEDSDLPQTICNLQYLIMKFTPVFWLQYLMTIHIIQNCYITQIIHIILTIEVIHIIQTIEIIQTIQAKQAIQTM